MPLVQLTEMSFTFCRIGPPMYMRFAVDRSGLCACGPRPGASGTKLPGTFPFQPLCACGVGVTAWAAVAVNSPSDAVDFCGERSSTDEHAAIERIAPPSKAPTERALLKLILCSLREAAQ